MPSFSFGRASVPPRPLSSYPQPCLYLNLTARLTPLQCPPLLQILNCTCQCEDKAVHSNRLALQSSVVGVTRGIVDLSQLLGKCR